MKIYIKSLLKAVCAVAVFAGVQSVNAQTTVDPTTDSQKFTVTVPSALSITGPDDRTLTHDATNGNQVFSPGTDLANHWAVMCNSGSGATVNLSTATPFVHKTNTAYKRDVKLDLEVSSTDNSGTSAIWSVNTSTATDQTNYAAANNDAAVQATSAKPGKGTLGLTVTFITNTYSTLLQGDYEVTVVGTITAN